MSGLFDIIGPLVRLLDAEKAHSATIAALKTGLVPAPPKFLHDSLRVEMCGLSFPNPVGLAPGFDKNAQVPDAMLKQGFGYVEIGTVTPLPQEGNVKPRLFRLPEDKAVINRMGFNNHGAEVVLQRLKARAKNGIVGVNIGANKTSDDRPGDYVKGIETFYQIADYLTVNISSPNTPGLRGMQSRQELTELLERLNEARDRLGNQPPMFLKIAPDLIDDELADICEVCQKTKIDALIISNTTLSREALRSSARNEAGGLSGEPLFEMSTRMLAKAHRLTNGKLPLIGVGGVSGPQQAFEKIRAGASLVQLYSAMVYQGPTLADEISKGLVKLLDKHNFNSIGNAVGNNVDAWL